MKKGYKLLAGILSVTMAFGLAACGNSGSAAGTEAGAAAENTEAVKEGAAAASAEKPIEIKLCAVDPSKQRTNEDLRICIDEIYERTNGMVDIQLYTDGQMLVYDEGIEAVMSNANVISVTNPSYLSDYFPVLATFTCPYAFTSRDVATEFYNGEYFQGIKDECEEGGVHIICADAMTGFRSMIATAPIQSVADLRKLNMRVASMDGILKLFEKMECNYQTFPFSECFNSLQTGAIDGLENTPMGVITGNFAEAVSPLYFSQTNHMLDGYFLVVGHDFWMSIPEEYRNIIDEVLGGWGKMTTANIIADEKELFAQMEADGIEVLEIEDLSEFKAYGAELAADFERGEEVFAEIAKIEESMK